MLLLWPERQFSRKNSPTWIRWSPTWASTRALHLREALPDLTSLLGMISLWRHKFEKSFLGYWVARKKSQRVSLVGNLQTRLASNDRYTPTSKMEMIWTESWRISSIAPSSFTRNTYAALKTSHFYCTSTVHYLIRRLSCLLEQNWNVFGIFMDTLTQCEVEAHSSVPTLSERNRIIFIF